MWLKLSGLIVKQVSKPVTNILKAEAKKYPRFSLFCSYVGQKAHYWSSRINVMTSGYKFVGVKPLADDVALSDGIAYVSEFTLFSIAGGIIVIEYVRGEKKNAEKSAKAAEKEEMMRRNIEERFTAIESKLDKLAGALERQEKDSQQKVPQSSWFRWWKE